MKKFMTIAGIAAVSASAFAAYQYDTALKFGDNANVGFSMEQNLPGKNVGTFSMYSLDPGKQTTVKSTALVASGGEFTFRDADGDFTEIAKDQKIGFWLEVDGVVYKSNAIVAGKTPGEFYVGFGGTPGNGNSLFDDSEFVLNVSAPGATPTGQPLPGVAVTLLLGGGAAVWRIMRRRKAAQKA